MKTLIIITLLAISYTVNSQPTLNKRKRPTTSTTVSQPVQKASPSVSTPVQKASQNAQVSTVVPVTDVRMKVKLPFNETAREFNVKKINDYYILNGDIIVGNSNPKIMSLAVSDANYKWNNATIPILIDASVYSNQQGLNVHDAIQEFNTKSVLCLIPWTDEKDYVRIVFNPATTGAGWSEIGRKGGEQKLFINDNTRRGNVMHELMHAAGFYHEQNRDDRDQFIKINYDNIIEAEKGNFQKEGGSKLTGYDYCSIMHYGKNAFINGPGASIECVSSFNSDLCNKCIGQRDGFSPHDLLGIEQLYGLPNGPKCNIVFPNPNFRQFASVTISESDKAQQMFRHRAEYATKNGFAAAFPNFHEATYNGTTVGGTILFKHGMVEWRDVPQSELRNVPLQDFVERMKAVQEYAFNRGFVGGFQNYFHANYGAGNVLGTYLLTTDVAEYRNVPQGHLGYPRSDDIRQLFTAVNDYAFRNGYLGGFPTFQIADYGRGTVYGVILIRKEAGEWRDVVLAQMPR